MWSIPAMVSWVFQSIDIFAAGSNGNVAPVTNVGAIGFFGQVAIVAC